MIASDGNVAWTIRQNLFKNSWTHVGVKCGCHAGSGDTCCVIFGQGVVEYSLTSPTIGWPTPISD